jgi:hypothetical protein
MSQDDYNLWLAVWNLSIQSGLSTSEALKAADDAVKSLKDQT